jgi:hypothetical protein
VAQFEFKITSSNQANIVCAGIVFKKISSGNYQRAGLLKFNQNYESLIELQISSNQHTAHITVYGAEGDKISMAVYQNGQELDSANDLNIGFKSRLDHDLFFTAEEHNA